MNEQNNKEPAVEVVNDSIFSDIPQLTEGVRFLLEKGFKTVHSKVINTVNLFTQSQTLAMKNLLENMNTALEKVDKKYSSLYGILVNKFLVGQDQKIATIELAVKALIEEVANMQYVASPGLEANEELRKKFKEDFIVKIEQRMESLHLELRDLAAKAMEEQSKGEQKQDVQPVQEEAKST